MQFAGTVTIHAPRLSVWELLMQPATFVRISPGVQTLETIIPNQRFVMTAGVTIRNQSAIIENEIVWEEVIAGEKLVWSSAVPLGPATILTKGDMLFSGSDDCSIEFSAELSNLPTSLPPALIHSLASNHIRSFFTNLKAEAEMKLGARG